ncbi:MAG: gliding motility-associated C-terminal domain-containing protein [Saprospiraceae bacterium]|nr:gliding motility-associated C-terminal domain-containing protein [Saprospiraceae bacterium]
MFGLTLVGQEICDNGVDDDGNGLIDLNDPGCPCDGILIPADVTDKIPNPSFENFNCCPNGPSQMDCTKGWIQATSGTSDYFHTCGFLFVPMVEAGLVPFPDGDGCSGTIYSDGWKEYIAACLTAPLLAGKKYDLRLQIASTPIAADGSSCNNGVIYYPPVEVTFFGSASCLYSPLATYDCPSVVDPGWQVIGTGYYDPQAAWGELTLSLEPTFTVNALMIGPPCVLPPGYGSGAPCYPYFYYDNLILEELQPVEGLEVVQLGEPCEGNLSLIAWVNHTGGTWQWYLDGVALPGETSDALSISSQNYPGGTFTVRYSFNGGCITSSIDVDVVMIDPTFVDLYACPGNQVVCAGEVFDEEGVYEVVLPSWQGCDSVVYCTITEYPSSGPDTLHIALCALDTFQVCSQLYDSTGVYLTTCPDAHGCDSTVLLDLVVLHPKAVIAPPDTLDCLLHPTVVLDASGSAFLPDSVGQTYFAWTGPAGGILSNPDSTVVTVGLPGQYCVIQSQEAFGILCSDTTCVSVILDIEPPPPPVVNGPTSFCLGDTVVVSFSAQGLDANTMIQWVISPEFDLVSQTDSTVLLTSFLPGAWSACAFIPSTCGSSDTSCQLMMVNPPDTTLVFGFTCDPIMAGVTMDLLQNTFGCDSLIIRDIQLKPSFAINTVIPTCDPMQIGTDTLWLTSQYGCDSLIIQEYDLTQQVQSDINIQICGPGMDHIDSLIIQSGPCDSLVITHYSYALPDMVLLSSVTCQQSEASLDTMVFLNQAGCDSIVVLEVSYGGVDTIYLSAQTCDSTQAGTVIQVYGGQYCDSVVVTQTHWTATLVTLDTLEDCLGIGMSVDSVWYTSMSGCDSLHITTTIHSTLDATITTRDETCFLEADGSIEMTQLQGGTPPYQYRISGGTWQSDPLFPSLIPGVYTVDVRDAAGCVQTYTGLVIEAGQQVSVEIGPDKIVAPGGFIDLSAQSGQVWALIQWSAVAPLGCSTCLQTTLGPVFVSQQVSIEVMSMDGCFGQDDLQVVVIGKPQDSVRIYIPNSFTPNGDGINDVFSIYGNDHVLKVRNLAVYDRWGNALYARSDLKINDPSAGWDGTFREELMDPGVYVYVVEVELVDGQIRLFKGDVTVVR